MPQTKHASKRKRPKEALPVLGVVGVSLSLAGGAAAATGGAAGDVPSMPSRVTAPPHQITLNEEEISDVSLGTFFVFDKEIAATPRLGVKFARCRCGGCGGCRGCGRGCRGCRGCGYSQSGRGASTSAVNRNPRPVRRSRRDRDKFPRGATSARAAERPLRSR